MTTNLIDVDRRIDMGSTEAVAWSLQREVLDLPVVLRVEWDGEPVTKSRAQGVDTVRQAEERIVAVARRAGFSSAPDSAHSFGVFAKFFSGTWQRRDVDNMLKLVCDALTGIVWIDDDQVSEMSASVQRGVDDPRSHLLVYQTIARRPPTKPCKVCGVAIRQYKSQLGIYCSQTCMGKDRQVRTVLTCTHCASLYELPRLRASRIKVPYCTETCRKAAQTITASCAICSTSFTRPRSRARPYCSQGCRAILVTGPPSGV